MNERELKALASYYEDLARKKEDEAKKHRKYAADLRFEAVELAAATAQRQG